jgi:hypothetical protein
MRVWRAVGEFGGASDAPGLHMFDHRDHDLLNPRNVEFGLRRASAFEDDRAGAAAGYFPRQSASQASERAGEKRKKIGLVRRDRAVLRLLPVKLAFCIQDNLHGPVAAAGGAAFVTV